MNIKKIKKLDFVTEIRPVMEHIHICIQMQLQTMAFYSYIYDMISVTKFLK